MYYSSSGDGLIWVSIINSSVGVRTRNEVDTILTKTGNLRTQYDFDT